MPAEVPVVPETSPPVNWVSGRSVIGGAATLAVTARRIATPITPLRAAVLTVATTMVPVIVPGTRPTMIHARPLRSRAWCSWRSMASEIGMPRMMTVAGSASGSTSARTGTVTRFIPNPTEPWIEAPISTAAAMSAATPTVMSTGTAAYGDRDRRP